ncbi:MAG: TonB-dependent receptor [Bryobacterales bacterium]|nr:TonB-dependent receptor [Bryobacterales bacterium]
MKWPNLIIVLCAAALSAEQSPDPLATLSLEQLLALDVTSVGKKPERLEHAAAAVFVITQEDIRRSGATSIPEALRLAPGLQVARVNGRSWAITARGFNGVFSTKLLVLIDGRSVFSPLYAGVWWDQDVMLDDIDRIEVIRGPAAAIWGANAINGVINIITRKATDTVGNLLTVTAGNEERNITRFRHGATFGQTGAYRVYGQYSHRFLPSPVPQFGDTYWGTLQGGFRLRFEPRENQKLLFMGDISQGTGFEFEHDSYPFFLPSSVQRLSNHRNSGSVLGRWEIRHKPGSSTSLQGYFDEVNRESNGVDLDVDILDAELQHRLPISPRHELTFSTGYRAIFDRTVGTETARFLPPERNYGIAQFSVVDGISLAKDRLNLTAGARFEHNTFSGWTVQPTIRAQWTIHRSHSAWAALSRALRAPSRLETGFERLYPDSGFGFRTSPSFRPEELIAYEAGYRAKLRKNLTLDLAVFRNRYEHLRSSELDSVDFSSGSPVAWFLLDNLVQARARGGEVSLAWNATSNWRLSGSYTGLWIRHTLHSGSTDVLWLATARSSPVHQWQTQSSLQLARSLHWNSNLYYYGNSRYGQRLHFPPTELPTRIQIDTRLAYRREATEWSIGVRNLTGNRTGFFVEPGPAPEPGRRAFYVRATWWF